MTKAHDPIADLIIDGLGGTGLVADLCQCSFAAVSQWRTNGIPRPRMQFLRLVRPKFDWSQIPDDYPPRETKADIADRIKASDDAQPPVGGSSRKSKK
ncbi:hypothetical protein PQR71_42405 [Paraburkholderia fungorum]|uniref:hypothetical protein n=1 Tax=Paraburkholderia fungorum TaxID=134537 RepID=UPI0038BC71C0